MTRTRILDACCGSRMFWYDRDNKYTVYQDNRELDTTLCDGRKLEITPGLFGDFRKMIYADNYFDLVVFDPPHLVRAGKTSWLAQKYGVLDENWKADIKAGFAECFRVLRPCRKNSQLGGKNARLRRENEGLKDALAMYQ